MHALSLLNQETSSHHPVLFGGFIARHECYSMLSHTCACACTHTHTHTCTLTNTQSSIPPK